MKEPTKPPVDPYQQKSTDVSDASIKALARSLYPLLREFYDSEEGQRIFKGWKAAKKGE